jgi:hypothetical protein
MSGTLLADLDSLDLEAVKALIRLQQRQLSPHETEIAHLKLLLDRLRRMLFGAKSEKLVRQVEQQSEIAATASAVGRLQPGVAHFNSCNPRQTARRLVGCTQTRNPPTRGLKSCYAIEAGERCEFAIVAKTG